MKTLTLDVERVAGESRIEIEIGEGGVSVKYISTMSNRLFEKLVIGRHYSVVPYIVSRICGVCSHAHFWASNLAIENALGMVVDDTTSMLRDACNKLQIIENNLMHLVFLTLPDYSNLNIGVVIKTLKIRGLLKEALNTLCGRLTNPQLYVPGGFTINSIKVRVEKTVRILEAAAPVLDELAKQIIESIELPQALDPSPNYLALSTWPEKSVPVKEPYELIGSHGPLTVNSDNYLDVFNENIRGYSNSKECTFKGQLFFVGARARLLARKYAEMPNETLGLIKSNPYSNLLAKAIEARYLINDLICRLRELVVEVQEPTRVQPLRSSGKGLSVVEAPRGLLVHYYEIDKNGTIKRANIITPTVMFTKHIEETAKNLVSTLIEEGHSIEEVKRRVEMLVRAYDPCIPCAVHLERAARR